MLPVYRSFCSFSFERIMRFLAFLLFVSLFLAPAPARSASVELLDPTIDEVFGMSGDGTTLVGKLRNPEGAFIWSNGVMTNLGTLGGDITWTTAYGLSPDNSVVVGQSRNSSDNDEAFRWKNGTMIGLGFLDETNTYKNSIATKASLNGFVVVGMSRNSSGQDEAFRWVNDVPGGTMTGLGIPGGYDSSYALAVSSDGSVVMGNAMGMGAEAFRWVDSGSGFTPTSLGFLDDTAAMSRAYAMSSDGSVVVGESNNSSGRTEAFRWVGGTMNGLGFLTDPGSSHSIAHGVSSDGSVVVGTNEGPSDDQAFRWTESTGMVSVRSLLEAQGVDLTGWSLESANCVSDDGLIIVGMDTFSPVNKPYIANLSAGGLITPGQLNQSLGAMSQIGPAVAGMGQVSMNRLGSAAGGQSMRFAVSDQSSGTAGADTQRGLSSGDEMPGRLDLWVVGSVGTNIELNGDDLGLHGGVGLTWETGEWRVGGGLFGDSRDLDTSYGGNQDIKAVGPGAFVAYSPEGTNLEFRVSGLWQTVSLDLKRGYANGAGSATSTGSTDAGVFGLSGRVQWTRGMSDVLALTPFAEYTWQNTHIDGYSESGGPFPASFDSRNETSNALRTGLRADAALIDKINTWAWLAWDHRFEDKSSGLGGIATGIGSFAYPGSRIDQDWADTGVGASWDITERLAANSSLGFALGCDDESMSDVTATIGFSYQLW